MLKLNQKENFAQLWPGILTAKGSLTKILDEQLYKKTRRGAKELRLLYPWRMANESFKKQEKDAPRYLEGVLALSASKIKNSQQTQQAPKGEHQEGRGEQAGSPAQTLLTVAGETRWTFHEALRRSTHRESKR